MNEHTPAPPTHIVLSAKAGGSHIHGSGRIKTTGQPCQHWRCPRARGRGAGVAFKGCEEDDETLVHVS